MISVYIGDEKISVCESVILIPERAVEEQGYIKVHTVKDSANAKHEYHAMAQMAYFQYQDDELEIRESDLPFIVQTAHKKIELESGLVLFREESGKFYALIHTLLNKKKLLEAGYRYCTRWVRLDI
jgi:hypothetical protein